jgi:hypothetical protein
MSKTTITRLFLAAVAAVAAGIVIGIAATVAGLSCAAIPCEATVREMSTCSKWPASTGFSLNL